MKKLLGILSICVMSFIYIAPASADWGYGVTLHAGTYETDGSETEKTVSGVTSEVTNHSEKEGFYGASIYVEKTLDLMNGLTVGIDYVPMDIELGSGERTDADAENASDEDGVRKASADIEDLYTIYTHIPVGPMYLLLGYHDANITTTETLPTSTYGDASVNGIQYGIGIKNDNVKIEVAYSDFDEISLASTDSSTQKIKADADALAFRLSLGF